EGDVYPSALEALQASYAADRGDEFVEPAVIGEPGAGRLEEGDGMFCFNYRSDRMREISEALGVESFEGFERRRFVPVEIATATRYRADFPFAVAFERPELKDIFPEIVSAAGLRQARIAETEKYAHVTFFFSGGREEPLTGEERLLVPSPKVATYDLQPDMSAEGVTRAVLESVEKGATDVYIINYANADMVGHTGIFDAACSAVAKVDSCLARIIPEIEKRGGVAVITADHGNAEMLWDAKNDQPHTAHTLSPVPIVFCSQELKGAPLRKMGVLADVAPSLLQLLDLEPSVGMNGATLFESP
ncbi:MAG: 2,3-bisphosphoglycerate-independent phosphoglycerate mutase, partial [Gammaproteobacteria bacterium]